jgi:predicted naringenin-chalcone synthase
VGVVGCECISIPQFADQMVWLAGDHGLQLRLSPELPDTLGAHLPEAVDDFLAWYGMRREQIRHWLVHPGGPQILDSVQNSLGLKPGALDMSRSVLRRYGNMSSPTILFILKEMMETRPHGPAVAMAFGPGLTIELALLSFSYE